MGAFADAHLCRSCSVEPTICFTLPYSIVESKQQVEQARLARMRRHAEGAGRWRRQPQPPIARACPHLVNIDARAKLHGPHDDGSAPVRRAGSHSPGCLACGPCLQHLSQALQRVRGDARYGLHGPHMRERQPAANAELQLDGAALWRPSTCMRCINRCCG